MGVFEKRINFKPLEYPKLYEFVDAINHSYWLHTEFNYDSDINDFHTKLNNNERNVIKRALLAISQIEINVKRFWSNLYNQFPKPEFDALGSTFGESEVRHSRSYAHLLEILGLNKEFEELVNNEVIQDRINYLSKYLRHSGSNNKELYTLSLALFSLFIENVSLFSQFFIIKSFNKEKNLFKGIDNIISATQKEETLHGLAGGYIVRLIKEENPEWFNEDFYNKIKLSSEKALEAELKIVDWIFESGEINHLQKEIVIEFIKDRFNQSLEMIDCNYRFEVNKNLLYHTEWFNLENLSEGHVDFFHKTSNLYNKKSVSITSNDLF